MSTHHAPAADAAAAPSVVPLTKVRLVYARADAAFADDLRRRLAQAPLAITADDRADRGKALAADAAAAIAESAFVVVVVSPAILDAADVAREVEAAAAAGRRLLTVCRERTQRFAGRYPVALERLDDVDATFHRDPVPELLGQILAPVKVVVETRVPEWMWAAWLFTAAVALLFLLFILTGRLHGPAGATGATGPVGPTGATGAEGPMGPQGPRGATGETGAPGVAGPQGPAGPRGADGAVGPTGPQGVAGVPGAAGATGPAGPMGARGLPGVDGRPGPAGPLGPQGPAGPKGDPGPAGPPGAPGATGPAGPAGKDGGGATAIRGTMMLFAGAQAPAGWTACDGRKVQLGDQGGRLDELIKALGTTWGDGGDADPTTVNLPDLRASAPKAGAIWIIKE